MNDSFTAARAILDSRPDSGPQLVTAHRLIEALGVSAFDLLAYELALTGQSELDSHEQRELGVDLSIRAQELADQL